MTDSDSDNMVVLGRLHHMMMVLWGRSSSIVSSERHGESLNWNCPQHGDGDDQENMYNVYTVS